MKRVKPHHCTNSNLQSSDFFEMPVFRETWNQQLLRDTNAWGREATWSQWWRKRSEEMNQQVSSQLHYHTALTKWGEILYKEVQLPYARHYNPRFVYFLPTFWRPKTFFQGGFFRKFCLYVWLVFKSGF